MLWWHFVSTFTNYKSLSHMFIMETFFLKQGYLPIPCQMYLTSLKKRSTKIWGENFTPISKFYIWGPNSQIPWVIFESPTCSSYHSAPSLAALQCLYECSFIIKSLSALLIKWPRLFHAKLTVFLEILKLFEAPFQEKYKCQWTKCRIQTTSIAAV